MISGASSRRTSVAGHPPPRTHSPCLRQKTWFFRPGAFARCSSATLATNPLARLGLTPPATPRFDLFLARISRGASVSSSTTCVSPHIVFGLVGALTPTSPKTSRRAHCNRIVNPPARPGSSQLRLLVIQPNRRCFQRPAELMMLGVAELSPHDEIAMSNARAPITTITCYPNHQLTPAPIVARS
jgi:hypothetical protein